MTLDQYLLDLSYRTNLQHPEQTEITAITSDSRQISPGCILF